MKKTIWYNYTSHIKKSNLKFFMNLRYLLLSSFCLYWQCLIPTLKEYYCGISCGLRFVTPSIFIINFSDWVGNSIQYLRTVTHLKTNRVNLAQLHGMNYISGIGILIRPLANIYIFNNKKISTLKIKFWLRTKPASK